MYLHVGNTNIKSITQYLLHITTISGILSTFLVYVVLLEDNNLIDKVQIIVRKR